MGGVRPDYSDAGYGQAGCALMLGSSAGGWFVGLVGSWLLAVVVGSAPAAPPADKQVVVVAGLLSLSVLASILAMWVIERVPRLWRSSDRILQAIWVAPGPIAAVAIGAGLDRVVDPLGLAVVAAIGWSLVDLVRSLLGGRALPRRHAEPHSGRDGTSRASLFGALLGVVAATGSLLLLHREWIVPQEGETAAAAANFAVGGSLALGAGVLIGLIQGRIAASRVARRPEPDPAARNIPIATLVMAAATSGIVLWWLASVNT